MIVVPQVLELFWRALEREVERQGRTGALPAARAIARRLPMGARRLLFRSHRARALGGGLRLFVSAGRLPPAGAPADVGGLRRRGHAGVRRHGDGIRDLHDLARPPDRDRRLADARGRDADRRRRRGPVPRPDRHAGLLAGSGGDGRGVHGGRLLLDRRPRPPRREGPPRPPRPEARHDRPAQRPQRLSRGHRERPAGGRDPRLRRAGDRTRPDRGDRPGPATLDPRGPGAGRRTGGGRLHAEGRTSPGSGPRSMPR